MPHTATRRRFVSIVGTAATAVGLSGSAAAGGTDGSTDGGDESGKNGDGTGEDDAVETTRFATFNIRDLTTEQVQSPGDAQAAAAARVIQGVRPDVLVLNEITNNFQEASIREVPTDRSNARAFAEEYLSESQRPDIEGLEYDFEFTPTSNTGVFSGFDFDNNGTEDGTPGDRTYGNDSFGFGEYPG